MYTVNISFVNTPENTTTNIVESVKDIHAVSDAMEMIDDTVDKALAKDSITGHVMWFKR